MSSRLFALVIWGLAAASVVFWVMRLSASPLQAPAGTRLAMNGPPVGADLSRLLGAAPIATSQVAAPPPEASRFKLTGVVATSASRQQGSQNAPGVALISIDGGPVRAYRVGDPLDAQLSLLSVALRSVRVGDRSAAGASGFELELPPPLAPATGTLAQLSAQPTNVPPPASRFTPPPPPQPQPSPPSFQVQGLPAGAEPAPGVMTPPAPSAEILREMRQ